MTPPPLSVTFAPGFSPPVFDDEPAGKRKRILEPELEEFAERYIDWTGGFAPDSA